MEDREHPSHMLQMKVFKKVNNVARIIQMEEAELKIEPISVIPELILFFSVHHDGTVVEQINIYTQSGFQRTLPQRILGENRI